MNNKYCGRCGNELSSENKFCDKCGEKITNSSDDGGERNKAAITEGDIHEVDTQKTPGIASRAENSGGVGKIISLVVFLLIIGFVVYNNLDRETITKNNDALKNFDSGDSETAISEFKQAAEGAVTDENKINTLKNIAYVYSSEGNTGEALKSFKEALALAKPGSSDFYLITGEIALLENQYAVAIQNYNAAYKLEPASFQVNNALALYYLNLETTNPGITDYEKALDYAKKAYEYDTQKLEITKQNLAIAYYFNNNFDRAIQLLSSSNLNQHPYASYWLGLAYAAKEDTVNAKLYLQKAVDLGVEAPPEVLNFLKNY
jgi:tetratricopeptide (TPR) repeat protein